MRHNHPISARECDALRVRWYGWLGPNRRAVDALRDVGWGCTGQPHWLSNGKIPAEWQEKMARHCGHAV